MPFLRRLLCVVFLSLIFAANSFADLDFEITTLRSGSTTPSGKWTSIGLTPSGIPRIVYAHDRSDPEWGNLSVYWDGIFRQVQSKTQGGTMSLTSLDLDGARDPVIAWEHSNFVYVGIHNGSYWDNDNPFGGGTRMPSLAVDDEDVIHCAYVKEARIGQPFHELWWGRLNESTGFWESIYVGNIPWRNDTGRTLAMDLGEFALPRIVFKSTLEGGVPVLRYATRTTSWSSEYLDMGFDIDHVDLVVDANDTPHISLYNADQGDLIYVTRSGGALTHTTIVSGGHAGQYSSIALDSNGDPHICFYNASFLELGYAYRSGGVWHSQVVGTERDVGKYCSIDVDDNDGVHISFQGANNSGLLYATWLDCNGNGTHDSQEIASGLLEDCDGNGIPDSCESFSDCNQNGIPDDCETDCNGNGVPDDCDITSGYSLDCNTNGIPDDCETDCDGNGIADACEIFDGTALDCNGNGVPDACDLAGGQADCTLDGEIDACQGATTVTIDSVNEGQYGSAVVALDFNNDDEVDIAVGAPWVDGSWFGARGAVYIYYGPTSPAGRAPDITLQGDTDDELGSALAAGDVNGDGIDDLITGSPGTAHVDVYLGSSTPAVTPYLVIDEPNSSDVNFGSAMATLDVNDDGHDELLVGAMGSGWPSTALGKVHLYLANPLQPTPHRSWSGESNGALFGCSVANAGDLDGNGLEDLVIGARMHDGGAGRAYVHFAQPGNTFSVGPVFTGEFPTSYMGRAVAGPGDVNDDGYDDLLLGAPAGSVTLPELSRAFLHLGSAGMDAVPDLVFTSSLPNSRIGASLSGAGDLNGDGVDDMLIGSDSLERGYVFFGGVGLDEFADIVIDANGEAGEVIAAAGDFDGDGIPEFLLGAPEHNSGDGRIYLAEPILPDFGDCNLNGITDVCDISSGYSLDDDRNGIPDECEGISAINDTDTPRRTRLLGAFPSPFNPRTEIAFEVGSPASVDLMIYDVSGRLVRALLSGDRFDSGGHKVTWQGRDDSGGHVAAGVYFYRFEADGHRDVGRVVLVK